MNSFQLSRVIMSLSWLFLLTVLLYKLRNIILAVPPIASHEPVLFINSVLACKLAFMSDKQVKRDEFIENSHCH